jgi:hypothetical protein
MELILTEPNGKSALKITFDAVKVNARKKIINADLLESHTATIGCMCSIAHYGTSRKVAGSSLDEVDFFNLPNPSSRTMALGSTQPLTEMSNRNPPGG